jgi:RNA polymerase sigma factor (sigma-70 family)
MNDHLSETELLKLASAGDRHAFSALYIKYIHQLNRYVFSISACKESAEEIIQDIFLRLWENRESLIYVTSFKSYIYRASKNMLLNHLKKKKAENLYITKEICKLHLGAVVLPWGYLSL